MTTVRLRRLLGEARLLGAFGNVDIPGSDAQIRKEEAFKESGNKMQSPEAQKAAKEQAELTPDSVDKTMQAMVEKMDKDMQDRQKTVDGTQKRAEELQEQAKKSEERQQKDVTQAKIERQEAAKRRESAADKQAKLNTEDYAVNAAAPVTFFTEEDHTQADTSQPETKATAAVTTGPAPAPDGPRPSPETQQKPDAEKLAKDAKAGEQKKEEVAKATGVQEQQNAKSA